MAKGSSRNLKIALALALIVLVPLIAFYFYDKERQREHEEAYQAAYKAAILPNDMLSVADVARGEVISHGCLSCHSVDKNLINKLGPNLFRVVGRGIASKADFEYSPALLKHKGKVWTTDELNDWLRDPSEYAPGTKMTFAGLGDPQDRMDLIGYLLTLH